MPNKPSAAKQARQSLKRRERNRAARSSMRTHIKRVEKLIEKKNADEVKKALPDTLKTIGKMAKRGIVHKRNAARKESRLMIKVNKFLKAQGDKPAENSE